MDIKQLYQELIIDHGTEPRNFSTLHEASHSAEGYNPLCGDKIQLFLKIKEVKEDADFKHNKRIVEACFQGNGCAISTASASLMTEILIGKTLEEAALLFEKLQTLITEDSIPIESLTGLGKLAALSGVRAFPARVKCATLPWHTLLSALKGSKKKASTE